jgi:hypothetical protein
VVVYVNAGKGGLEVWRSGGRGEDVGTWEGRGLGAVGWEMGVAQAVE